MVSPTFRRTCLLILAAWVLPATGHSEVPPSSLTDSEERLAPTRRAQGIKKRARQLQSAGTRKNRGGSVLGTSGGKSGGDQTRKALVAGAFHNLLSERDPTRHDAASLQGGGSSSESSSLLVVGGIMAEKSEVGGCPTRFTMTSKDDADGPPKYFETVSSFSTDYFDPWWTLEKYDKAKLLGEVAEKPLYRIGSSTINRCGVFAGADIPAGTQVDLVWVQDDATWYPSFLKKYLIHVTPWFGFGMNHCSSDKANIVVKDAPDGAAWGVAERDIPAGTELLVNYNQVFMDYPLRIRPAWPWWDC